MESWLGPGLTIYLTVSIFFFLTAGAALWLLKKQLSQLETIKYELLEINLKIDKCANHRDNLE